MKKTTLLFWAMASLALFIAACSPSTNSSDQKTTEDGLAISGKIEAGLRVLTFDRTQKEQNFRIYRGDYVVPQPEKNTSLHLVIPELKVDREFPVSEGEKTYFKVPAVGVYHYTAGHLSGIIEAVEYSVSTYQEVSALEAVDFIKNRQPFVLDVRSSGEFASGHLEGAALIPVGSLKKRIAEIETNKEDPIFVYCKSGNRSTVAARILIDAGFKQVINLRHGVNDWKRQQLHLVR